MRKRLFSGLLALLLCLSFAVPAFAEDEVDKFSIINQIAIYAEQNYKFGVTSEQLKNRALEYMLENNDTDLDNVLTAMLGSLDDYTRYFTKEQYENFTGALTASLRGIGVRVRAVKSGAAVSAFCRALRLRRRA